MGVLEQYVAVGREVNYGAAVAQTRAYEAMADNFEREIQYVESMGFRAGIRAERADRYTAVTLGASGSLELAWLNSGMGLLLFHILGGSVGPTPSGANFSLIFVSGWERTTPFSHYSCGTVHWSPPCGRIHLRWLLPHWV